MTPIPRIFEGQPVVIVAGGPSLTGFDWRCLKNKNVIAINRAHEFLPDASVLWWSDAKYWRAAKESLLAHKAMWKATCQLGYHGVDALPDDIKAYRLTGVEGFDPEPGNLRHGNNSAYAAMHLAAHLGAGLLILLGVDMRHGPDGATHFHGGHGRPHYQETLTKLMAPYFASLAEPLAARGIKVINASLESALTVWPRCSIDDGLKMYDAIL